MLNDEYQYHIKLKRGDVGKYVILTGDPGRCERIASYFEMPAFVAQNREYVTYTGYLCGEKVSVTSTGIGGPSAAIALEELVKVGADTFIRVGTCGGMQHEVLSGDIVVATSAIRMEGTSREYLPIEFPAVASFDVVLALTSSYAALSEALGVGCHTGVIQSKDSFYGQHSPSTKPVSYELLQKWEAYVKGGALASEMECAALFAVSSCLRVRTGAVLYVVNNQEREKVGLPNKFSEDTQKAIRVAVDAIKRMIANEKS